MLPSLMASMAVPGQRCGQHHADGLGRGRLDLDEESTPLISGMRMSARPGEVPWILDCGEAATGPTAISTENCYEAGVDKRPELVRHQQRGFFHGFSRMVPPTGRVRQIGTWSKTPTCARYCDPIRGEGRAADQG